MAAGWAAERLVVDARESGLRGDRWTHHASHRRSIHHPPLLFPYMEAFVRGLATAATYDPPLRVRAGRSAC